MPDDLRDTAGLCRGRDRADDLVQECLLRVIDHPDSLTPGAILRKESCLARPLQCDSGKGGQCKQQARNDCEMLPSALGKASLDS